MRSRGFQLSLLAGRRIRRSRLFGRNCQSMARCTLSFGIESYRGRSFNRKLGRLFKISPVRNELRAPIYDSCLNQTRPKLEIYWQFLVIIFWTLDWICESDFYRSDVDGKIRHYHVTSGKLMHTLTEQPVKNRGGLPQSLAREDLQTLGLDYAQDGSRFATVGTDYIVRIYDPESYKLTEMLTGGYVSSFCSIQSFCIDSWIQGSMRRLWDIRTVLSLFNFILRTPTFWLVVDGTTRFSFGIVDRVVPFVVFLDHTYVVKHWISILLAIKFSLDPIRNGTTCRYPYSHPSSWWASWQLTYWVL